MTHSQNHTSLPLAFSDRALIESTAVTAKLLGSLFYLPVSDSANAQVLSQIKHDQNQAETGFGMLAAQVDKEDKTELAADFQQLFEGCDVMPAPPWSSVYLDREQVIFGDSTLRFREFLKTYGIDLQTGMREPEDQFGLILFVLATLCEQQLSSEDTGLKHQFGKAIQILLSDHLMPWAPSYLSQMQKHAQTTSYQMLSELAGHWLDYLKESFAVTPLELKIYFTGPEYKPFISK